MYVYFIYVLYYKYTIKAYIILINQILNGMKYQNYNIYFKYILFIINFIFKLPRV